MSFIFNFLLNEFTSFSEDTVFDTEYRVTTMSLKEIRDADESTVVSCLRTAIVCLSMLDKLSSDIITKLLYIFEIFSVFDFNDLFRLLFLQRKVSK